MNSPAPNWIEEPPNHFFLKSHGIDFKIIPNQIGSEGWVLFMIVQSPRCATKRSIECGWSILLHDVMTTAEDIHYNLRGAVKNVVNEFEDIKTHNHDFIEACKCAHENVSSEDDELYWTHQIITLNKLKEIYKKYE